MPETTTTLEAPKSRKSKQPTFLQWLPWEKFTIWGLFLLMVYTLRHFFFIFFMTFILSYIMRSIVVWVAGIVSPGKERPWLERILAVACFGLLLLGLYGVGQYFGPKLIAQGQALVGRLTRVDPEQEFNNFLNRTVGAYMFRRDYGDPTDPRYQKEFEEFEAGGPRRVGAYQDFPAMEASIEAPFDASFDERHGQRIRADLNRQPAGDPQFDEWFLKEKALPLFLKSREANERAGVDGKRETGEAAAAKAKDARPDKQSLQRILDEVKSDPLSLAAFQQEYKDDVIEKRLVELRRSPEYEKEFREYYEQRREANPSGIPYEYEKYHALKVAHEEGELAFTQALGEPESPSEEHRMAQLHHDFQLKKQEELAQDWWLEGPTALLLRHHVNEHLNAVVSAATAWIRTGITQIITIPVQLALSLLLSFFITFDIPNLRKGIMRLKESRVSDFYDEIAPGLISFARLIGRAFEAQGVIALFNTLLTFVAIKLIGIENEVFLCAIVFICSFIPVLGVIFSSVPIAVMAIVQPGGSMLMAIYAVIAILIIHFIETSILNPKIVGDMLHFHPVMVLAVLAIGEHFFGVWGLLLGVPVAVYILRFVILNEGIPGIIEPVRHEEDEPPVNEDAQNSDHDALPGGTVVLGSATSPAPVRAAE